MNSTSRYVWLDWIKALAITLVVLFHSGAVTCKATAPLLAMGVPLFFVANGALVLRKERDISYFIKKVLKILFLIVFWGTLTSLSAMHFKGESLSVTKGIVHALNMHMEYGAHIFWFLGTLFTLYCIYPIIQHSIGFSRTCLFLLIISFLFSFQAFGYRIPTFEIPNILVWWQGECIFYAVGGYVIIQDMFFDKSLFHTDGQQAKLWTIIAMIIVFLALYSAQQLMWTDISLFSRHTPERIDEAVFVMYRSPFVMLMTIVAAYACKKLFHRDSKVITIIGSNTLGIYVTHCLFMGIFHHIFESPIVIFVLSLICSLLFSVVMQKNRLTGFLVSL